MVNLCVASIQICVAFLCIYLYFYIFTYGAFFCLYVLVYIGMVCWILLLVASLCHQGHFNSQQFGFFEKHILSLLHMNVCINSSGRVALKRANPTQMRATALVAAVATSLCKKHQRK